MNNNLNIIFILAVLLIILISMILIITKLFKNQANKDNLILQLIKDKKEEKIVYIQQPREQIEDSILPSPFFITDVPTPFFNDYSFYDYDRHDKEYKKIKNEINMNYTGNNGKIKINID